MGFAGGHPTFRGLFEESWLRDLRNRLHGFLVSSQSVDEPQPHIYSLIADSRRGPPAQGGGGGGAAAELVDLAADMLHALEGLGPHGDPHIENFRGKLGMLAGADPRQRRQQGQLGGSGYEDGTVPMTARSHGRSLLRPRTMAALDYHRMKADLADPADPIVQATVLQVSSMPCSCRVFAGLQLHCITTTSQLQRALWLQLANSFASLLCRPCGGGWSNPPLVGSAGAVSSHPPPVSALRCVSTVLSLPVRSIEKLLSSQRWQRTSNPTCSAATATAPWSHFWRTRRHQWSASSGACTHGPRGADAEGTCRHADTAR